MGQTYNTLLKIQYIICLFPCVRGNGDKLGGNVILRQHSQLHEGVFSRALLQAGYVSVSK